MPPYTVLHVLETAQVECAGVARIVSSLGGRIDPSRYKLHVLFLRGPGPLEGVLERKGITVQAVDWVGGKRNPIGMWRFFSALREKRFSIVHQHVGGRSVRWISRIAGVPYSIVHLHGRVLEKDWTKPAPCFADDANVIIATSKSVARWCGTRAEVVYPGMDVTALKGDESVVRPDLVIGTAGRLVPVKGLEYLIRALPLVKAGVPDISLEIAGAGREEERLRSEVTRLGLDARVRFLGWQAEVPFHRWNVFVMPSLEEAFGIAALEAMAAGLPVVASAVGGLPELVEDGRSGWLVPPADPDVLAGRLIQLLQYPQERDLMGLAARNRVGEFSTKRMCDAIEKIYDRLLLGSL